MEEFMSRQTPVITIDGPSGAGKGTISQLVANRLGWHLLDSGAIYRVLALSTLHHDVDLKDDIAITQLAAHLDVQFQSSPNSNEIKVILEGEDVSTAIRRQECGNAASVIAAYPNVREALLQRQRAFSIGPGLVADGRDMGTIVFPNAPIKVFLTASAEERAQRRYNQLQDKGFDVSIDRLLAEIKERDQRDSSRSVAPLIPAKDALLVDSTGISIEDVLNTILKHVETNLSGIQI